MSFFYIYPEIYHPINYDDDSFTQYNSKIFIYGSVLYIFLLIWIKQIEINKSVETNYFNIIKKCFWILIFINIFTILLLYKDFINTNIINKFFGNEKCYLYNKKKYNYNTKSPNLHINNTIDSTHKLESVNITEKSSNSTSNKINNHKNKTIMDYLMISL